MPEALIAQDLSVRRGDRTVVDGVSLRARYGEVTALIGPNGAGKSTLLRALIGILPSRGTLQIEGRALSSLGARERARSVAYVPQQTQLTGNVRVEDVVGQGRFSHRALFGAPDLQARDEVVRALREVGAAHLAERAFNRLSGGEQRRVLLARALATQARVLLLDEPTAGLDVAQVMRFHALTRTLAARGFAVVTVLHDLLDVCHYADRATLLARGRVIAEGTAREVVASPAVAEVYGVRLRADAILPFELVGEGP